MKNLIEEKIYKRGINNRYIVFREEFYNDFIGDGNEKIICDIFICNNLAILINAKLKFIDDTFKDLINTIEKEGLKPRSELKNVDITNEGDEDTLGDGIYCHEYEIYTK